MGFGSSSALLLDPVCLLYMSSLDVDKERDRKSVV